MPFLERNEYPTPPVRRILLGTLLVTLVITMIVLALDDNLSSPVFMLVIVVFGVIMMAVMRFHAQIALREEGVTVGFRPLFRRTISYADIANVDAVQVRALRDYGGWGIRRWPRSSRGLLLTVGGEHGVSILTKDGRRYIVGCLEPVDDLVDALRQRVG